jgi:hypothetical protein
VWFCQTVNSDRILPQFGCFHLRSDNGLIMEKTVDIGLRMLLVICLQICNSHFPASKGVLKSHP